MMAWGPGCSSWDDSVDLANLEQFNFGEVPDDRFVMTTWHESEPLLEVFEFSKFTAMHPTIEIENTLILHVNGNGKAHEFTRMLQNA
jgi:hypothetical protein